MKDGLNQTTKPVKSEKLKKFGHFYQRLENQDFGNRYLKLVGSKDPKKQMGQ